MEENSLLNVSSDNNLGKVEIAPEVIEVIAGIAASEVEGISAMRGSFATGVVERFGKKAHNKGVKVDITEEGVLIDLYVVAKGGSSIPEIAEKLQTNIKQSLYNMTALEVKEINVHVVGIEMDSNRESENS